MTDDTLHPAVALLVVATLLALLAVSFCGLLDVPSATWPPPAPPPPGYEASP